jgi:hypothetical protein
MALVSIFHNPSELQQEGPRLSIDISAPDVEVQEGRSLGLEYPNPLSLSGALIDTGSSLTVVNPQVAVTCKLRQTGFVELSAAGSLGRYPQFAAKISFPGTDLKAFAVIPVVACPLPRQKIWELSPLLADA